MGIKTLCVIVLIAPGGAMRMLALQSAEAAPWFAITGPRGAARGWQQPRVNKSWTLVRVGWLQGLDQVA